MEISWDWTVAWLAAVSLLAVLLTAWDKSRARRHAWRVSEGTVWFVAVLGGCAAMCLTMLLVNHKTRHRRFMFGLPILLLAQFAAVYALLGTNYLVFI